MKSRNIQYLVQVDHVRAFAALWIILYHGEQVLGAAIGYGRMFTPDLWHHTANPLAAVLFEGHSAVALFMVLARPPKTVVLEMLVLPGKEQPRRARGVRQLLISPSSLRSLCPLW